MNQPSSAENSRLSIIVTIVALLIWAGLMATGTFLHSYRTDFRKPLVVMAFMLTFLTAWIVLLAFRRRSVIRTKEDSVS